MKHEQAVKNYVIGIRLFGVNILISLVQNGYVYDEVNGEVNNEVDGEVEVILFWTDFYGMRSWLVEPGRVVCSAYCYLSYNRERYLSLQYRCSLVPS